MIRKLPIPEIIVITCAVLLRLIPHPANMAPIGALALFGGAYVDKKYAFFLPLLALFLSDMILGFHSTMIFVYGSFLISGAIGYFLRKHKTFGVLTLGSLASSTVFFLITNTGVWLTTPSFVYAKSLSGYMHCLAMGIPFFRYTILGDLLYLGTFCLTYILVKQILLYFPATKHNYANIHKKR